MLRAFLIIVALMGAFVFPARAEWRRDETSLAWLRDGRVLWAFSFDPRQGKPHFATLAPAGANLVAVQPSDHVWHYGLWFSWKLINGVNFWEETGPGRRAEGVTRWQPPEIETDDAGRATIRLELAYVNPAGQVLLTESRVIQISAPEPDGSFAIDWAMQFVAGRESVVLDRTPMPGEPDGQVNGGYGGLGFRAPSAPPTLAVVTPRGPVERFETDRARPQSAALACNLTAGEKTLGGVAILSLAPTAAAESPISWYVVATPTMRFMCAAILAPRPLTYAPGDTFALRYRILARPQAWTPEALRAAVEAQCE
ncbi:MAG: PmoA family protein [Opitutaceae bacterium]